MGCHHAATPGGCRSCPGIHRGNDGEVRRLVSCVARGPARAKDRRDAPGTTAGIAPRPASPSMKDPTNGPLRGIQGAVDRGSNVVFLPLDDDARKTGEDHLRLAELVDTSAWPVHVLDADGDSFDRRRKLSQLHPEPAPDVDA